jgi:hypothetical protein
LALHARNSIHVDQVKVSTVGVVPNKGKVTFEACGAASVSHADALSVVLQPPTTAVENDEESPRGQGDTQYTRGAVGMTTALRAASVASHMGELRVSYLPPTTTNNTSGSNTATAAAATTTTTSSTTSSQPDTAVMELWLEDLLEGSSQAQPNHATTPERQSVRHKRLTRVAQQLASSKVHMALKVELVFTYPLLENDNKSSASLMQHYGGWHVCHDVAYPHVYTTSGTYGDFSSGPRTWVPTLDSAKVQHRASHELTVRTTARATAALQCLGAGETMGRAYAVGHYGAAENPSSSGDDNTIALGTAIRSTEHVQWWKALPRSSPNTPTAQQPDVVPPDQQDTVATALYVTHVWTSAIWTPIPVRSLGWAIGPWAIVEDPEYFAKVLAPNDEEEEEEEQNEETADTTMDTDDDPMDTSQRRRQVQSSREARWAAFLDAVRQRGEGIRQAYFMPRYARAGVFIEYADWSLVSSTRPTFQLPSNSAQQQEDAQDWQDAVTRATIGVPHRALSLTRDVLALPTYRTVSYTQIWIPSAVDGGCTSGALADCPEVALNPFLGGAILDARLLPPPRARLPFVAGGGRVLQYAQARAALRGWIRAALPLGGDDEVGFGYLHCLVEALLFSLYERGHGSYGSGGGPGSFYYSRRYAPSSGLNSSQLDFLPIRNVVETDLVIGGASVPIGRCNSPKSKLSPCKILIIYTD